MSGGRQRGKEKQKLGKEGVGEEGGQGMGGLHAFLVFRITTGAALNSPPNAPQHNTRGAAAFERQGPAT